MLHYGNSPSFASEESPAKVERLHPAANDIIPDGAILYKLATGYTGQKPIWIHEAICSSPIFPAIASANCSRSCGEHLPATQWF